MLKKSLKIHFIQLCEKTILKKTIHQLKIIELLIEFFKEKKSFFKFFLTERKIMLLSFWRCRVGKTMILNHFFDL